MISFFYLESQKYDKLCNSQELSADEIHIKALLEAALELKKFNFNPNERDEDGETILCYVVMLGRLELVDFLVKSGADVNLTSYDRTVFPLEEAARWG